MNRRQFLKSGLVAGAGFAAVSAVPAVADHIIEPQTPIIGIGLHLYHYTNRTATFQSLMQIIPENGVQPAGSYPVTVQVQEPDSPGHNEGKGTIVGTLQAYETKFISPTLPIDPVSGLPIVDFNMRVEPKVAIGTTARQAGAPSEHWNETLRLSRVVRGNNKTYMWAVPWLHANTPPHKKFNNPSGYAETSQANQSLELIPPGEKLIFEHVMICLESGRIFRQELRVIIGPLPGTTTTTTTVPTTTTAVPTTTVPPTTTTPATTTTTGSIAN